MVIHPAQYGRSAWRRAVRWAAALLLAVPALAAAAGRGMDALPINQLQVLGTHNSYARPIDPQLVKLVQPRFEALYERMAERLGKLSEEERALLEEEHPHRVDFADARRYAFPPLREQLDAGLRSLELDLYHDPEGGTFLDPAGYRALRARGVDGLLPLDRNGLAEPGLKVLHAPDVDFRSHCNTFTACLRTLGSWSDDNPDHVPVFVLLELKTRGFDLFEDGATVHPFDEAAYEEIDQAIYDNLGRDRVLTPGDVRGDHPTLNAAVRAGAWPTLASVRGRFLFLLITAGDLSSPAGYLSASVDRREPAAFVRARPGEDHAAFLMLDNAIVREAEIRRRVREGYLVRTRADIDTWEARKNDHGRARAALRSGAQVISTDFYQPGNAFGTNYVVTLPGPGVVRRSPAFD